MPARRTPAELLDAIVLPTGVPVGGDVFVPGCFGRVVAARMRKATIADDWSRPVGIVRSAIELPAGDPRLSVTTPDGAPWPAGAGGLLCRVEYLSTTADGQLAGNTMRQTGPGQRHSVGFRVLDGEQKAGVRHIRKLDLFTISPRTGARGVVPGEGRRCARPGD